MRDIFFEFVCQRQTELRRGCAASPAMPMRALVSADEARRW